MIRELKTFATVAREGSFAAAGQKIGLTQAAVSAQMQRLEAELGFSLFERSARAANLNPMGQQTLAQVQELLRLYGALGAGRAARGQQAVFVTLGAIASAQQSLLPDALAKFHKQLPGSRTRVVPGVSLQLVHRVDAGEIDLAVVIRPPFALQPELRWTDLAHEPFRLLVPRHTPGDDWAALLAREPFIRYDRGSFGGRQVDRFLRTQGIAVHEVCELDELDALVRLVANGLGVALVPQTARQHRWPAAVRAIDLGPQTFHRDIGIVHRADATAPVLGLVQRIREAYSGVPSGRRITTGAVPTTPRP